MLFQRLGQLILVVRKRTCTRATDHQEDSERMYVVKLQLTLISAEIHHKKDARIFNKEEKQICIITC